MDLLRQLIRAILHMGTFSLRIWNYLRAAMFGPSPKSIAPSKPANREMMRAKVEYMVWNHWEVDILHYLGYCIIHAMQQLNRSVTYEELCVILEVESQPDPDVTKTAILSLLAIGIDSCYIEEIEYREFVLTHLMHTFLQQHQITPYNIALVRNYFGHIAYTMKMDALRMESIERNLQLGQMSGDDSSESEFDECSDFLNNLEASDDYYKYESEDDSLGSESEEDAKSEAIVEERAEATAQDNVDNRKLSFGYFDEPSTDDELNEKAADLDSQKISHSSVLCTDNKILNSGLDKKLANIDNSPDKQFELIEPVESSNQQESEVHALSVPAANTSDSTTSGPTVSQFALTKPIKGILQREGSVCVPKIPAANSSDSKLSEVQRASKLAKLNGTNLAEVPENHLSSVVPTSTEPTQVIIAGDNVPHSTLGHIPTPIDTPKMQSIDVHHKDQIDDEEFMVALRDPRVKIVMEKADSSDC